MKAMKNQTLRVLRDTYSNATSFKTLETTNGRAMIYIELITRKCERKINHFEVGSRGGLTIHCKEFNQYDK